MSVWSGVGEWRKHLVPPSDREPLAAGWRRSSQGARGPTGGRAHTSREWPGSGSVLRLVLGGSSPAHRLLPARPQGCALTTEPQAGHLGTEVGLLAKGLGTAGHRGEGTTSGPLWLELRVFGV